MSTSHPIDGQMAAQPNPRFSLGRLRRLRLLQHNLPRFRYVDAVLDRLERDWPDLFKPVAAHAREASALRQFDIRAMQGSPGGDTDEMARAQQTIASLEQALKSSREIGAACGILMATEHLSQDQAFDRLRVASQCSNRKLRDIAADVLFIGTIPGQETHPYPKRSPRPNPPQSRP